MRLTASRRGLLILLMLILAFNYVDRFALGLMVQDIKDELALSDTEVGLLTGIAFALFYSVLGIPIARWADRGNRVAIIILTTALWSVAVALCGAATSFLQLMLIRIGVAVGEAGCIPPALSLISDYFTREERPRAIARYMLGAPLALILGYFVAGWLTELYGWRATFVILGSPGLVLAALAWLTLREPRREHASAVPKVAVEADSSQPSSPTFKAVCGVLWANTTLRHLLFCYSVWLFFGYGIAQWTPAFFIRSHGLQPGELGIWFAVVYGVFGVLGMYLGGELATRYAAGNERLQLRACAVAFIFFPGIEAYAYLTSNYYLAFGVIAIASLGGMARGPILAIIQSVVPPPMRATAMALVYLFGNLIGLGLGPLAVGMLSDELHPWLGNDSLRYALVVMCPGYFWAAWYLWSASRTVMQDMKATQLDYPTNIPPLTEQRARPQTISQMKVV